MGTVFPPRRHHADTLEVTPNCRRRLTDRSWRVMSRAVASIMLSERITSSRDTLGAYLPMLAELTGAARGQGRESPRHPGRAGGRAATWEGMQGSFKVHINSFYGYLGYSGGLFNDYDAAERVTLAGSGSSSR